MSLRDRLGRGARACRDSPGPAALAVVAGTILIACGGDGDGITPPIPSTVAEVEVTSPIGSAMALGRTVQLSAVAKDRNDNPVTGVQFSWQSSNTAVATVSGSGLVTGVAAGNATVTATAEGVSGNLGMRVVAADLGGISAVLNDPFAVALVSNLTGTAQANMQATLGECSSGTSSGNLEAIQNCLDSAQSQVGAATDPDDKALLAVFALFLGQAERLLNL
ncbi:MAG: Ig-like domain-containing protein [Gemmatimonadota bacterium]|nr:MAG: Ig-like domain-containing protein [Gemmatimonadota bacterium]